jgi:hypothetical protein
MPYFLKKLAFSQLPKGNSIKLGLFFKINR